MYIPKHFSLKDSGHIVEFIKTFNFGTLASISDSRPVATHLPFAISGEHEEIKLTSHFARANTQWQNIEDQEVLVIFTEPHAYISPRFYDKKESVPTWNYISVHAYGKLNIISDDEEVFRMLETMIRNFDPVYEEQWKEISMDYKTKMAKGIVAFEIDVTEIQAAEKLSQNKNKDEKQRIRQGLSVSDKENERLIGHYMK